MLKLNNFASFKISLIPYIASIFILSFLFENYFKFELGFSRLSIVEIIFIIMFFLTLIIYKFSFIKFIFKIDTQNILEIIIYSILILKIIKYSLNFQNYYNLYELLIWIYMLSIYIVFKFYLINYKNLISYIENSFIALSLAVSAHILYSFLLYKSGYDANGLWTIKDTTYYPYIGTSSINFKSIFSDYNQAAHLVAPGFLFLLNRFNNKLIFALLIIFYSAVMFLMKSKFLIIFFGILTIYLIINNLNLKNIKLTKLFIISSIIGLTLFYIIITHLVIIERGIINSTNFHLFKLNYFTDFVIPLNNYDIYGSLFLKLKYTVLEIASSYDYILFENLNYFNHQVVLKNFDYYIDPHSDYFGALANYGIVGFLLFLGFPIYIVLEYLKNFNLKKSFKESLIYFLIIQMILIEAIIIDIFHTQFIWVIFAIYVFNVHLKKSIKYNL